MSVKTCNVLDPNKCTKCNTSDDCEQNAYCRHPAFQKPVCRNKQSVTNLPNGNYCEGNSQCNSGFCFNWVCKGRSMPYCTHVSPWKCFQGQSECNNNSDCQDNAYCRMVAGQPNACRPKKTVRNIPGGQYCDIDAQCKSGKCTKWTCKGLPPPPPKPCPVVPTPVPPPVSPLVSSDSGNTNNKDSFIKKNLIWIVPLSVFILMILITFLIIKI